jgi:hypothetical protein
MLTGIGCYGHGAAAAKRFTEREERREGLYFSFPVFAPFGFLWKYHMEYLYSIGE